MVVEWRWDCLSYCLMTNHIHLLVRTSEPNLGHGMQQLHSPYAQGFNLRYGRVGHLFQDRFGSSRVRSGNKLWQTADYIAQNPVRASLCATPEEWRWSSTGAAACGRRPPWMASPVVIANAARDLDYEEYEPLRVAS